MNACGYRACAAALHFHHVGDKAFGIGTYAGTDRDLAAEIEKCVVLCANCHTEVHNAEPR